MSIIKDCADSLSIYLNNREFEPEIKTRLEGLNKSFQFYIEVNATDDVQSSVKFLTKETLVTMNEISDLPVRRFINDKLFLPLDKKLLELSYSQNSSGSKLS